MRQETVKTGCWLTSAAIAIVIATCLAASPARAADSVEDRAIKNSSQSKSDDGGGYWTRVVVSLAAIAGLIFLARHLLRRAGNSSRLLGRCQAVEVLARTSVSMKHQVVLVKMGRRVLMVGLSPQGMNTLCELTDRDEIADVLESLHKGGGDDFLQKVQQRSVEFGRSAAVEQPSSSLKRLSDKLQNSLPEDRP